MTEGQSDHDLLVRNVTLQEVLIRRVEEYIKSNNERLETTERGLKEISINQVRLDGDITTIKGWQSSLEDKLENLEKKQGRMDVISYAIGAIAAVIAYFK